MPISQQTLLHTLKTHFGYDSFRGQQQEIIETVLNKHDAIVIMPTGGGKSICFQLPALLFPGVTLVISPLIALMKDQVDGLKANGISAAFFNSSQGAHEQDAIMQQVVDGTLKLLYVAPESLQFLEPMLDEKRVSCVAIDEAHCISSWGHDFRPGYTKLGFLKRTLPNTPVIALTATADKATRNDIATQLEMPQAKQFLASFDRPNISLEVQPANDRMLRILNFINQRPDQSGIIYCLSRKSTEQLADKLRNKGINARAYHAGIEHTLRAKVQEDFVYDRVQIVCATIAFGMGIDKSNVRWVIHYNMPKNIEGYYQEIGRAGRDGLPSKALLFHSFADVIQLRNFMEGASNIEFQRAKLDRMMQFADATSCRRKILLSYFGELLEHDCGNCDVCKNPPEFFDGTILAQKVLSVITRLKQQEPIGMIIDVLRGAHNQKVVAKNYHQLKSYGVGRDVNAFAWQQYIIQLINQGYCEIAFHKNNILLLTEFAQRVLFSGERVRLTRPVAKKDKPQKTQIIQEDTVVKGALFDRLKKLRTEIAQEEGIAAYLIFSDKTLIEMERARPTTESDFLDLSGVGQHKLEMYGDRFMNEVSNFLGSKKKGRKKSDTYLKTFDLYKEGLSIEEIGQVRNLKSPTIFSHIAKLYTEGFDVDLYKFVSQQEVSKVKIAKQQLNSPKELKPYYDFLDGQVDYFKIRLALTIIA